MNITEMRALLNVSRAEFSRQYNIPVRTLENWESGKTSCPEYVRELLEKAVISNAKKENREENMGYIFEGTHYGVEVKMEYLSAGNLVKNAINALQEKGYPFKLLPIYPKGGHDYLDNMYIDVIRYEKDDTIRYMILCGETQCIYYTTALPDDLDLNYLVRDIEHQYRHKAAPAQLESKYKKLFYEAFSMASSIIGENCFVYKEGVPLQQQYIKMIKEYDSKNGFRGIDYRGYEHYRNVCEKIAKEQSELFYDSNIAYLFIVIASVLAEKGYDYSDMVTYASVCDDEDEKLKEEDLKRLEIGYEWRRYK